MFKIDKNIILEDENIVRDDLLKIDNFVDLKNLYFILDVLNYRLHWYESTGRYYVGVIVLGEFNPQIIYKHDDYESLSDALPRILVKSKKKQHKKGYNNYFKYVIITDKMRRLLKNSETVKEVIKFTLNEIEFTVDDKMKKEKLEKFLHYLLTN